MTPLTPDQREYKEKTLAQLQSNLPLLEAQLQQETRREVMNTLQKQVDDTHAHIDLLQQELAANTIIEPAADDLYQRIATALTNKKFFLAKKLIARLETIEPFYPGLNQLHQEAEAGRASRRTQAIAQRGTSTEKRAASASTGAAAMPSPTASQPDLDQTTEDEPEKKGLAQFFQFHIVISCLVVMLILCIVSGMGGILLLQWLVEGA